MSHNRNDALPARSKGVKVKKVNVSILKKNADLIARELNYSEAYVEQTLGHEDYPEAGTVHAYAAYLPDKTLAGFSLLIDHPHVNISILRMATVLNQYRGRGIYKELFRKRASDAYERGIETVICHADEKTAALILEQLGMKKHQRFTMSSVPVKDRI